MVILESTIFDFYQKNSHNIKTIKVNYSRIVLRLLIHEYKV